MVTVKSLAAGGALWCALLSTAGAHDTSVLPKAADSRAAHMSMQEVPAQQQPPLATGAAFDVHHRLWGAWVEGAHVVAHSDDAGRTLSAPATVNAMPEPIYTSAENRPKIATSPDMQLAMVAMDVYDDNGPAISRALAQMHLPPQVAQYVNAEPMPERLSGCARRSMRDGEGRCRAPYGSGAMAHAKRAADC